MEDEALEQLEEYADLEEELEEFEEWLEDIFPDETEDEWEVEIPQNTEYPMDL